MNWMGPYGFYEAADYTQSKQPELVRSWMAHHQGMCLLALTNLLKNNIVQDWFHGTPRVRAAELLLHEKPLSKETLKELSNQSKLQQDRVKRSKRIQSGKLDSLIQGHHFLAYLFPDEPGHAAKPSGDQL